MCSVSSAKCIAGNEQKAKRVALCNSYTMGCPPVRGGNPRALASYLTYR